MSKQSQSPIEGNRYFLELGHVPESMTLLDIWAAITERKWFISLITLVFVGLFAGLGMMAPTKYKAEVVVAEANPMSSSSSSSSRARSATWSSTTSCPAGTTSGTAGPAPAR